TVTRAARCPAAPPRTVVILALYPSQPSKPLSKPASRTRFSVGACPGRSARAAAGAAATRPAARTARTTLRRDRCTDPEIGAARARRVARSGEEAHSNEGNFGSRHSLERVKAGSV